jgi:segregation and condensation protein B
MSTAGARRKKPVRTSKNGSGVAIVDPVEPAAELEASSGEASVELVADAPSTASGGTTAPTPASDLDRAQLKTVLESLIFVSERTVTPAQLARSMKIRAALVRELVRELISEYAGRGIELIEVAGGYQFRSAPSSASFVRDFIAQRPVRLTRAQLETLALIAYRQPITRPEIDEVRGVDSGSAMRVLLERGLIKMLGRKDEPGRPLLYGSTTGFLEFFGMRSLKDLPTLREFTELSGENRALFKRKTGEDVEDAEAELLAAEEASRAGEPDEHISDEDLAELAREADAEGDADDEDEPRADADADARRAARPDPDGDDEDDDEDEEDEDDDDLDDDEDDDEHASAAR